MEVSFFSFVLFILPFRDLDLVGYLHFLGLVLTGRSGLIWLSSAGEGERGGWGVWQWFFASDMICSTVVCKMGGGGLFSLSTSTARVRIGTGTPGCNVQVEVPNISTFQLTLQLHIACKRRKKKRIEFVGFECNFQSWMSFWQD